MGSTRQLLRLDGESLVRRAVTTALASPCARVFVVVGAEAAAVTREIEDLPVALFARRHFDALRRLSGDRGGKALLVAHGEAVVRVPFAEAAIDLDTPDDYERLLERLAGLRDDASVGIRRQIH